MHLSLKSKYLTLIIAGTFNESGDDDKNDNFSLAMIRHNISVYPVDNRKKLDL